MDFVWAADWHAQKANHFRGFVIFSPYYTSIIHGADYSFEVISIETYAPQFIGHNKFFLGSVSSLYPPCARS